MLVKKCSSHRLSEDLFFGGGRLYIAYYAFDTSENNLLEKKTNMNQYLRLTR